MDITMMRIESSSIAAAGWERASETLRIQFDSGGVYDYAGVSQQVWEDFMKSLSKGSYFSTKIRGVYPFTCVQPRVSKSKNGESHEAKVSEKEKAKAKIAKRSERNRTRS